MQTANDGCFGAIIAIFYPKTIFDQTETINSMVLLNILKQAFAQCVIIYSQCACWCIWHNLNCNIPFF